MIRNLITLIVCFFIINDIHSQTLSLDFDAGYGFKFNPKEIVDGNVFIDETKDSFIYQGLLHSFGEGYNYGISLNYSSERLRLGIFSSYLDAKEVNQIITGLSDNKKITTYKSSMLRIGIEIGSNFTIKSNKLYVMTGAYVGLFGKINSSFTDGIIYNNEFVYHSGISSGIVNIIGWEIKINNNVTISPEIKHFSETFIPRRGEIIQFKVNGQDKLNSLDYYTKHIEYVSEYTESMDPFFIDRTKAQKRHFISFPYSSIGINIVFKFAFN